MPQFCVHIKITIFTVIHQKVGISWFNSGESVEILMSISLKVAVIVKTSPSLVRSYVEIYILL